MIRGKPINPRYDPPPHLVCGVQKGVVTDVAAALVRPAQVVIVVNDQFAISRQVDVELDGIRAFVNRTFEGGQRAFRRVL